MERAVLCGPEERHPYQLEREALERSADGGPTHPPIQNTGYGLNYLILSVSLTPFTSVSSSLCGLSQFSLLLMFSLETEPHQRNVVVAVDVCMNREIRDIQLPGFRNYRKPQPSKYHVTLALSSRLTFCGSRFYGKHPF